jgi:hypothetical protein
LTSHHHKTLDQDGENFWCRGRVARPARPEVSPNTQTNSPAIREASMMKKQILAAKIALAGEENPKEKK